MGSIARMDRCEMFINEFKHDACVRFDMSAFPAFSAQCLAESDGEEVVRMYVLFDWQGHEEELMMNYVFFNPEDSLDDSVDLLCDLFDIDGDEAERRLKKAGLF
jgi:hypothetical protein